MPRESLTPDEHQGLLDSMPEGSLRQGVLEGIYYIQGPGDKPGKPVIRHAVGPQRGKPVKGTGAVPGSSDRIRIISKATGYKRTNNWRALVEDYWGPKLPDMFLMAEEMMKGGMVTKTEKVQCPCGCGFEFPVTLEMYKKGDAQALKVVWESVVGRATERKEVDVNIRSLIARLDARQDSGTLEIVDLTPEQVTERMALAAGADAVYREVDDER